MQHTKPNKFCVSQKGHFNSHKTYSHFFKKTDWNFWKSPNFLLGVNNLVEDSVIMSEKLSHLQNAAVDS